MLPNQAEMDRLLNHLRDANIPITLDASSGIASFADPDAIKIEIMATEH